MVSEAFKQRVEEIAREMAALDHRRLKPHVYYESAYQWLLVHAAIDKINADAPPIKRF